jgi:hypothetical protein
MVSGGNRPTAPQNNPANVSATGGNGQSGQTTQAPKYISGLPYGQGQATMAQQQAAPMSGGPAQAPSMQDMLSSGGGMNTLLSPTDNPAEPITAGASVGPGPGPEVLPKSITGDIRSQENVQIIAKYIPALVEAMKIPDAPDSYKRFVNSLLEQMPTGQAQ